MSQNDHVKIGIIGGAGYAAGELISLLQYHPHCSISWIQSESQAGKSIQEVHPFVHSVLPPFVSEYGYGQHVDVLFLCRGHGFSKDIVPKINLDKLSCLIDLSRDFRLGKRNGFIYGLPELHRNELTQAKKIANPGCFATAIQLALLPLAANGLLTNDVHVHAITGSTGAGQRLQSTSHFTWRNNNVSLYKVLQHQHLDEILQGIRSLQKKIPRVHFVPIRGNFTRGILASLYVQSKLSQQEAITIFQDYFDSHAFVHITEHSIALKEIVNTNMVKLQIQKIDDQLHITSILDNLIKGAAGQAIQNMNLALGIEETTGLLIPGANY